MGRDGVSEPELIGDTNGLLIPKPTMGKPQESLTLNKRPAQDALEHPAAKKRATEIIQLDDDFEIIE